MLLIIIDEGDNRKVEGKRGKRGKLFFSDPCFEDANDELAEDETPYLDEIDVDEEEDYDYISYL